MQKLIDEKKHNIIGIYNSEEKYAHFKRNIEMAKIKCVKCNISDPLFVENIRFLLSRYQINFVIHSAAMKHVDICEDNPSEL